MSNPLSAQTQPSPPPHIYLAGDSTMAEQDLAPGTPQHGWGQLLPKQFAKGVHIENLAMGGRSARSFVDEGRWLALVEKLQPGDWVIIQFGHNDQKKDKPTLYAEARTDYRAFLIRYAQDCRGKGANPILVTSIYRRFFDGDGEPKDSLHDYPIVTREAAAALDVPLVDLNARTRQVLKELGPGKSKALFLHFAPGEVPFYPNGMDDNTHLSLLGATTVAELFASELRRLHSPLCRRLEEPSGVSTAQHKP